LNSVTFVPEAIIRSPVDVAFALHHDELSGRLPSAEIHHVGSTAVPGSLTKGDLDIQVCVSSAQFGHADCILSAHYRRNVASTHTETFSSFKDDNADPPLGIQLTVTGSPDDIFCTLRDYLIQHADVNEQYNELKRQFEGAAMDDYRAAKSTFLESLLEQIHFNVA
jgi:GrpB-like predicted nucleotidyltransferase (UPF0157 family)